ncbi:MAG: dihydrofolate reductase [Rhizobacter sp.]|nr:dihydrofolate reductase [Rhizobacter sp.]
MSQEIVVASQLGLALDAQISRQLPHVRVVSVPMYFDSLPLEARVLIAAFNPSTAAGEARLRPKGWPFGLEWVQLVSAGIDAYPDWLFEVPLMSTARGTSAHPVAEWAIAALFAAAKDIPSLWVSNAEQWTRRPLATLHGSTLGIVGFGAIGQALAQKAIGLGMRVKALRRSTQPFAVAGVERAADIVELFANCDHVVLAAPATAETHHLVNAELLAQAKPGLHLVNVARGSIVDQNALLAALDNGRLGFASLDVTDPEPLPTGHPLYSHPRVRISPHTAAISAFTQQALVDKFVRNLAAFQAGEPIDDTVEKKPVR